jgi:TonB family protein
MATMRPCGELRCWGRSRIAAGVSLCLLLSWPAPQGRADEAPLPTDAAPPPAGVAASETTSDGDNAPTAAPAPARFETQISFDSLIEQKLYAAAAPEGERLVDLTAAEFGDKSIEVAKVLTELGDVQRRLEEHDAAEKSFMRAIDIVRASDGLFSPQLIDPMVGLGTNYEDSGDYLNALSVFNEARAINRRAYGILNAKQVPIIDLMSETLYKMDRGDEANDLQLDALQLAERTYGVDSIELLDALYKYGTWLRSVNDLVDERQQYLRAIDIIRNQRGDDSPLLVKPLREIGNSLRAQRIEDGHGEASLRHALDILEAQPERDPLAIATVLRDLGDWQTAFTRVGTDGDEYRQAWNLLGEVDNGDALRREWFDSTQYVLYEPMSLRDLSTKPEAVPGHVLVKFDLDEAGRPENVEVMESDPPGFKDDAAVRALKRSRFRPHMASGEFIPAHNLALNFTYRYLPDEKSK